MSCRSLSSECPYKHQNPSIPSEEQQSTNRFIYIKQQIDEKSSHSFLNRSQKVLVNPHFKKNKVFVNPKFPGVQPNKIHLNLQVLGDKRCINSQLHQQDVPLPSTKIHINPNAKSVQLPLNVTQTAPQTVHINPNFKNPSILGNILLNNTSNISYGERKENVPSKAINKAIVLTRTKLIRTPVVNCKNIKRRNSVKSKYKIVKSHSMTKTNRAKVNCSEENKNRFKVDNRRRKSLSTIVKNHRKYLYINRFLSFTDLAKTQVIKSPPTSVVKNISVVNISGHLYKKSRTSLRRASITSMSLKKLPSRTVQLSKYKLVKSPVLKKVITRKELIESKVGPSRNSFILKKYKIVRKISTKKNKAQKVLPTILRKCNIPCPYYKKYGFCKGKENGKCFRKHDPDQIALCTRFLQGACIKDKCHLSHNVSSEKMPTCKYYLEGSCSRENCPYLHVKINPKAEVCRDFLEGFCKKAAECDKRHQYLCPDYEKYGDCLKQRCPYPHGKMVRNYMSNKTTFAKKCSKIANDFSKNRQNIAVFTNNCSKPIESSVSKNEQVKENQRYYEENKSKTEEFTVKPSTSSIIALESSECEETAKRSTKNFMRLQSRPKLGTLPAFIPFDK